MKKKFELQFENSPGLPARLSATEAVSALGFTLEDVRSLVGEGLLQGVNTKSQTPPANQPKEGLQS